MNTLRSLIPWLLALVYLGFVMRGAEQGPAAPDGGQHAINGALIHDYLRSDVNQSPVRFATEYLKHYPAVSLGYHPPVFHCLEAVFYFVFGVQPQTARLTVAVCAALSVVLFYRLVRHTHESDWFAILCTVVFFTLHMTQQAASDVMLEFPSLLFVLLALQGLLDFSQGFHWRSAIWYSVMAGLAVWTKQHAVFLGLVPFLLIATTGRWRELKRLPIWASALLFGGICLLLAIFMKQLVGEDYQPQSQIVSREHAQSVLLRNLRFYPWRLSLYFGWPTLVATLAACFGYLWVRFRAPEKVERLALYTAWAAAVLPVPLVAWQNDERYLFAGFPAYIVILLDMVRIAAESLCTVSRARYATVLAAVLLFGWQLGDHVTYLRGPAQAAEFIMRQHPKRVLVCGRGEYQFVFTMRCLAGETPSMVILRGSKVPKEALQTEHFDKFAHEYGIEYVLIGDDWKVRELPQLREYPPDPWDPIREQPTEKMQLLEKVPMTNSFRFMEGDMLVYRFTNPSPNPVNRLELWMHIMNRKLEVDVDESEQSDRGPQAE